jgi:hypothetical protein
MTATPTSTLVSPDTSSASSTGSPSRRVSHVSRSTHEQLVNVFGVGHDLASIVLGLFVAVAMSPLAPAPYPHLTILN